MPGCLLSLCLRGACATCLVLNNVPSLACNLWRPRRVSLACASFAAAGSNKEGVDFLAANKGKDGVITLPSGMQVK